MIPLLSGSNALAILVTCSFDNCFHAGVNESALATSIIVSTNFAIGKVGAAPSGFLPFGVAASRNALMRALNRSDGIASGVFVTSVPLVQECLKLKSVFIF